MHVPIIIKLFKYVTWYTVLFKYAYSAIRLFKHVYRLIQLLTHGPWLYLTYWLHVHLHNPSDNHSPITFLLSPYPTWQILLEIPSCLLPSQWRGVGSITSWRSAGPSTISTIFAIYISPIWTRRTYNTSTMLTTRRSTQWNGANRAPTCTITQRHKVLR